MLFVLCSITCACAGNAKGPLDGLDFRICMHLPAVSPNHNVVNSFDNLKSINMTLVTLIARVALLLQAVRGEVILDVSARLTSYHTYIN
jgi:hypothetical protein